eukprot:TRINITY_DN4947_c0_g1_i29.p1 TRINITY_DN4947_c0_g1~~TRINITY_DN4947_c0_g1_i29.p1  ORF type:complete len:411 (+),score=88.60 TRINITY_DN4947_c0_g1_i29:221-1453(+)
MNNKKSNQNTLHNSTLNSLSNSAAAYSLESKDHSKRFSSFPALSQELFVPERTPLKRKKIEEPPSTGQCTQSGLSEHDTISDLLECHESISYAKPFPRPPKAPKYSEATLLSLELLEPLRVDTFYLENRQGEVDGRMVLIVMDWVMEVCEELCFRRSTFHYAVNYMHRYLACTRDFPRKLLQLLGLSSLLLAAKLEEIAVPKLEEFHKLTANEYSLEQIQEMEQSIAKSLSWKLAVPTTFFWTTLTISAWDNYSADTTKFRDNSTEPYRRYRLLMQIVDGFSICVEHLQYDQRVLAASALYVLLAVDSGIYCAADAVEVLATSSRFLLESSRFNDVFKDFIFKTFGFSLEDLLPGIQYVATLMDMPFEFTIPAELCINSEDLFTLQTHNLQQVNYFDSKFLITHNHLSST